MTHANHRQGTYDNLCNDFVAIAFTKKAETLSNLRQQWAETCLRHQPIYPSPKRWQQYVFDHKEKVVGVLKDLAIADLGLSVTISGLFDQIWEACRSAGIAPHTVNHSLGFWGRTEKLPSRRILEFTTMCGHEKVSSNLVWHLAEKVKNGSLSIEEAASEMGRPCLCNIFNEVRAAMLLQELVADLKAGKISKPQSATQKQVKAKTWGMIVDERRCTGCLDCVPYCPMSAIVAMTERGVVAIDPEECVECGTCFRTSVCPTGAIVPGVIEWPHTLRPDLSDPYVPDQSLVLGGTARGRSPDRRSLLSRQADSGGPARSHDVKDNDVTGRYGPGRVGIIVEMGRPVLGTTLREVQKVTEALAALGIPTLKLREIGDLVVDESTGRLRDDILDEKVNRCYVEVEVSLEQAPIVLQRLREVARGVNTVFAVGLISLVGGDGSVPTIAVAQELGMEVSINGKTNVGLGRPLVRFS